MAYTITDDIDTSGAEDRVREAMNPETFDVLAYLTEQPVAEDSFDIYTHTPSAKKLHKLMTDREAVLAERRAAEKRGETSHLSISDDDEDTEFDDEINALVQELERTKLTFHVNSVAPALIRAIDEKYLATSDKTWTEEEKMKHNNRRVSDILSRAIVSTVRGDGAVDDRTWTADMLIEAEKNLYETQAKLLIGKLWEIVYIGEVFDEALTSDFSSRR